MFLLSFLFIVSNHLQWLPFPLLFLPLWHLKTKFNISLQVTSRHLRLVPRQPSWEELALLGLRYKTTLQNLHLISCLIAFRCQSPQPSCNTLAKDLQRQWEIGPSRFYQCSRAGSMFVILSPHGVPVHSLPSEHASRQIPISLVQNASQLVDLWSFVMIEQFHATDFGSFRASPFRASSHPIMLVEFDRSKTPIFSKVHQETTFPMWTFKTPSA
eukprot:TRINITY_DN2015_c0_g1_i8.p1 TRINITY_DN2015_c0_g1~~TRINITY_DN2015_c0_g1_i8.p1  ORF type:complete len:214 (-),score=29.64 TRINITY_DN2015_c0_g1_i8:4-645(-)